VQLSFDADSGLEGTLHSGDHVDVLVAVRISKPDGTAAGVTRRLLSDIEVMRAPGGAADVNAAQSAATSGDGAAQHVLLKVTDSEANKLLWAQKFGNGISLMLRPKSHPEDGAVTAQTVESVLLGGLNDKQLRDLVKHSAITAN
jgi:Flp pilus assembly protein CpaB